MAATKKSKPKKRPVPPKAPKAKATRTSASVTSGGHSETTQLLVIIFTLLSVVFLAMAYYAYS